MGVCYKGGNFNTSVNFARWLLESEAPTNHVTKAQQVLQACERQLQDANKLNYDFINPFVVCGATFTPIYCGQKDVSYPYCIAQFVPSIQGNLCTICELAVVGSDASRLLCSTTQIRWCQHWTHADYAFLFQEVSLPAYRSRLMLYSTFENHVEKYAKRVCNKYWKNFRAFLRDWKTQFIETEMVHASLCIIYCSAMKKWCIPPKK